MINWFIIFVVYLPYTEELTLLILFFVYSIEPLWERFHGEYWSE